MLESDSALQELHPNFSVFPTYSLILRMQTTLFSNYLIELAPLTTHLVTFQHSSSPIRRSLTSMHAKRLSRSLVSPTWTTAMALTVSERSRY